MAARQPAAPSMARRPTGNGDIMIGGEYKRLESIGQGSFAVVYKAVHPVGDFHEHRIGVRRGVLERYRILKILHLSSQSI